MLSGLPCCYGLGAERIRTENQGKRTGTGALPTQYLVLLLSLTPVPYYCRKRGILVVSTGSE